MMMIIATSKKDGIICNLLLSWKKYFMACLVQWYFIMFKTSDVIFSWTGSEQKYLAILFLVFENGDVPKFPNNMTQFYISGIHGTPYKHD